ncbi:MAG: YbhN family protein [Beijerinckiaceae bacterium]
MAEQQAGLSPASTPDPKPDVKEAFDLTDAKKTASGFWLRIVGMVFSVAILALSAVIVTRILLSTDYHALRLAIRATSMEQFAIAAAFTAISYLALTGYDVTAIKQLQLQVKYRTAALASFTSYAISFTLGFPLVTGGTVRYWIYSQAGLRPGAVASLTLIAGITFWLGMTLVAGVAFILRAEQLASLNQLSAVINMLIGSAAVGVILLYVYWVSRGHRRLNVKGMILELPGFGLTTSQLVLGSIDLVCASAVLYILLPAGHGLDFISFVAIYVFATLLGIASHAPGGIGAFEATILGMVPTPSTEALLAALLLFRVVYYLVPFVLAFALLGANEGLRRWQSLRAEMITGKNGKT